MDNVISEKQNNPISLTNVSKIISFITTVIFWAGLGIVIFVLLYISPRFRNIYQELETQLSTPTQLVINHPLILCIFILIYGLLPLMIFKFSTNKYKYIGIIVFCGFGIITIGLMLGFITVAYYLPLYHLTYP